MINVNELCFCYSQQVIFKNISFTLEQGEICAVLGKNGVGKTTLLKIIAGLDKPDDGQLFINGSPVVYRGRVYEDVVYLRQNEACDIHLTVFEVLILAVKGDSFFIKREEKETVCRILEKLKIAQLADRYLYQLSGGQLKMVFIAQALCRKKQILLLDEPTSNLDYYNQMFIMQKVYEISRKNRLTVLVTIHDVNMALTYSDKVLVIANGGIYAFGRPEQVITSKMMRDVFGVETVTYEIDGHRFMNLVRIVK